MLSRTGRFVHDFEAVDGALRALLLLGAVDAGGTLRLLLLRGALRCPLRGRCPDRPLPGLMSQARLLFASRTRPPDFAVRAQQKPRPAWRTTSHPVPLPAAPRGLGGAALAGH